MTIAYDPTLPGDGEKPSFPPLLHGVEVKPGVDPFAKAIADATAERAEVGHLYWSPEQDTLRAAVVFAPEETLAKAVPVLFAVANGLNDSLGALAPPEVGVQHVWPDGIKINGGWCGAYRAEASTRDPEEIPDWLVVGLSVSMQWPDGAPSPGDVPWLTALSEEGCGHLSVIRLLESWARHLLVWINRWEGEGDRPITDAWLARAEGWREAVAVPFGGRVWKGAFLGLDEAGGMVLKTEDDETHVLPLAAILDAPRTWPPDRAA